MLLWVYLPVYTDSSVVRRVMEDFAGADPSVAVPVLRSLFSFDEKAALEQYDGKLILINSNTSPTNTTVLDALGTDYHLLDIEGTGHYPMNEQPEAFNQALQGALEQLKPIN